MPPANGPDEFDGRTRIVIANELGKDLKEVSLDSNIFISETKKNEQYSEICTDIISRIGSDFFLCKKSGIIGAQYGIYSTDSLYFQTALDSFSILVSLDDEDFIKKLKDKNLPIEIYHPKDFPY
jgi:hypothetical protein